MTTNTLFVGRNTIFLVEVDSTNNFAMELVKSSAIQEGTAILAEKQSAGRGQREQTWMSESGKNITTSIIFKPKFLEISNQFNLSIAVSLAVCDFLKQEGLKPEIKWPNDILVSNRKIAGILIECLIRGEFIETSIVGIGLNVNQIDFGDVPNAGSLKTFTGKNYEVKEVFSELCSYLEKRYLELRNGKTSDQKTEYLNSLFRYKVPGPFIYRNTKITATITGISKEGQLELISENGELLSCGLKEISFVF